MRVIFTTKARQDLRDIGDFIAADNVARARSFVIGLREACRTLSENPLRFPRLEGFIQQDYRRRVHGTYLTICRVKADTISIVRIVSASMDLMSAEMN